MASLHIPIFDNLILRESAKAAHEDRQDAGGLQLVAWMELEAINRRDSPEGRASERLALFNITNSYSIRRKKDGKNKTNSKI